MSFHVQNKCFFLASWKIKSFVMGGPVLNSVTDSPSICACVLVDNRSSRHHPVHPVASLQSSSRFPPPLTVCSRSLYCGLVHMCNLSLFKYFFWWSVKSSVTTSLSVFICNTVNTFRWKISELKKKMDFEICKYKR